jgi:hypothetical protein
MFNGNLIVEFASLCKQKVLGAVASVGNKKAEPKEH